MLGKCVILRHEFGTSLCRFLPFLCCGEVCDQLRLSITPAVIHLGFCISLLAIVEELLAKLFHFCLCSFQRFLALRSCFSYGFVDIRHVLGIFHEGVADVFAFCRGGVVYQFDLFRVERNVFLVAIVYTIIPKALQIFSCFYTCVVLALEHIESLVS